MPFSDSLTMSEPEVLSLNAQAGDGTCAPAGAKPVLACWFGIFWSASSTTRQLRRMETPRRGWYRLLLQRGCRDSSWRCICGRCTILSRAGRPGRTRGGPPPYWLQVNHHFFFVLYSFVAMGIVTVFRMGPVFSRPAGRPGTGNAAAGAEKSVFRACCGDRHFHCRISIRRQCSGSCVFAGGH